MKIAVIGAGVSGLTFAAAMRRCAPGTEVDLYERDASKDSRPQGYAIGLRNGLGLKALDSLGLRDSVLGQDAVVVKNFEITDQDGKELLALPSRTGDPNTTYRVQRAHLMDTLLEAVGGTPIHYGQHCTGFEQTDGHAVATFDGDQRVTADYVVACDGVASAIRQQLIGDSKHYLGLTSVHAEAPIHVDHPLLDGGYFMMLGNGGSSFFCYRQPIGAFWSYTVRAASEAEVASRPREVLLQRVANETADWHELVRTLVKNAAVDTVAARGYYDKEPASRVVDGHVVLIGDAAHPMNPFQGQGANMAIIDAVKVAEFFAGDVTEPKRAVALDEEIVKRGRKVVMDSRANARRYHETRRVARANRNLVFRLANLFIRTFSKRDRT